MDKDPSRRELFEVMAQHKFFDFQYQRKLYYGRLIGAGGHLAGEAEAGAGAVSHSDGES